MISISAGVNLVQLIADQQRRIDEEARGYPEAARIALKTAISFEEAKRLWLALGGAAGDVAADCSRHNISPDDVLSLMNYLGKEEP